MNTQLETMSPEDIQRNIDRLIAKHELLNGKVTRSALLLFGLVALYLLILRGSLMEMNLGFFNFTDIELVRLLVAPLFAAYYLYFLVTGFEVSKVNAVLGKLTGEPHPLKSNPNIMSVFDIRSAILPYSFYKYFSDSRWEVLPKWFRFVVLIFFVVVFLALVAPHAFLAHLLYSQLSLTVDLKVGISVSTTIMLQFLTLCIQFVYFRVSFSEYRVTSQAR